MYPPSIIKKKKGNFAKWRVRILVCASACRKRVFFKPWILNPSTFSNFVLWKRVFQICSTFWKRRWSSTSHLRGNLIPTFLRTPPPPPDGLPLNKTRTGRIEFCSKANHLGLCFRRPRNLWCTSFSRARPIFTSSQSFHSAIKGNQSKLTEMAKHKRFQVVQIGI